MPCSGCTLAAAVRLSPVRAEVVARDEDRARAFGHGTCSTCTTHAIKGPRHQRGVAARTSCCRAQYMYGKIGIYAFRFSATGRSARGGGGARAVR